MDTRAARSTPAAGRADSKTQRVPYEAVSSSDSTVPRRAEVRRWLATTWEKEDTPGRTASPRDGTELPAVQDPSANQGCAQVTGRRVHAVPGGWHWRGAAAARLRGWWGRNTREDHAAGPLEVANGLFAVGQVFQGLPRIPRRVEPSPADQHLGAPGAGSKLEDRGHLVLGFAVQARDRGRLRLVAAQLRRPTQIPAQALHWH